MKSVQLKEAAGAAATRAKNLKLKELGFQRTKLKRRMLGNVRFIGELFLKQMLSERNMFMCVEKLLPANVEQLREARTAHVIKPGETEPPRPVVENDADDLIILDEENLEALIRLLETAGKHLDGDKLRDEEELAQRIDRAPDMSSKQKKGKKGKAKNASALDVCFDRMRALVDNTDIPICNRIRFLMRDVIELRANKWVAERIAAKKKQTNLRF